MFILFKIMLCAQSAFGAKILVQFLIPSASHHMIYHPILKELSIRGHELTIITPNPMKDPTLKNFTEIDVSHTKEVLYAMGKKYFEGVYITPWTFAMTQHLAHYYLLQVQLDHPPVKALLNDKSKHFDVVIIEPMHPLQYAYGGRFNCPMIAISAHFVDFNVQLAVGNIVHPITTPEPLFGYVNHLTFLQRIKSVLFSVLFRIMYNYITLPLANLAVKQHFGDNIPYLGDLQKNLSVLLTYTHPLLHGVRSNMPNVIELGTVAKLKTNQTISKDIIEFLDSASEGVIYFSLGSMINPNAVLANKLNLIVETFSKLSQKVLWKWNDDRVPDLPKNVKMFRWIVQEKVLQHPNTVAFITHGGPKSIEESVSAHIPVLMIPIQFDQFLIAERAVAFGIGRKLDIRHFNGIGFEEALLDVIYNLSYKNKIRELSRLMDDQPMSGLDRAVWWIEYVVRNKGARHLRSFDDQVPFYQYYMIDVAAVTFLVFFVVSYITYKLMFTVILKGRLRKIKTA